MSSSYKPQETEHLLVCTACGTQFPTADRSQLKTCFICDDPRQFVPAPQQTFTTLAEIRSNGHGNEFTPLVKDTPLKDSEVIRITTVPRFAIGQRAHLIRTSSGKNILWDCVTLLDQETIRTVNEHLGGIHAVVISHPHFYSAHLEWAEAFGCPVYLAREDEQWVARRLSSSSRQVFLDEVENSIVVDGVDTGVKAIKLGGHFPGSMVLLHQARLFIADTLFTTPSGLSNYSVNALGETQARRSPGSNSFAFMWSIPNYIPLSADEVVRMWGILKNYDFSSTHGGFAGQDIEDQDVKARVLQSMQIQIRAMGHANHPFLHSIF